MVYLLPGSNTLNVSILKIFEIGGMDARLVEARNERASSRDRVIHSRDRVGRCTCTDNITPLKVVYQRPFDKHVTESLSYKPPINTITTLYNQHGARALKRSTLRHANSLCLRPSLAKQLVFVLRTTSGPQSRYHSPLKSVLEYIRHNVFAGMQMDKSPNYVLVNFETLLAPWGRQSTAGNVKGPMAVDIANAGEEAYARYVKERTSLGLPTKPYDQVRQRPMAVDIVNAGIEKAYTLYVKERTSLGLPTKPYNQVRQGQIKFVSMKTYLTEYDWRGEFTEEQVKQWLA